MSMKKPYERFGSYLLLKKLETDRLGDVWRAAEIAGESLGGTAVVRRFTAGDRPALERAMEHAHAVASAVTGTTFVRNQRFGIAGNTPYIAFEYPGGRSLRHVVEKARASTPGGNNPIPVDQALSIVEKLAFSAENLGNMKYQGARLTHGALLPHFVWISDEGEVRTGGQQLGAGLVAALGDSDIAREIGPYLAPELRAGGEMTKSGDVYSLGAILYVLLTGQEPEADSLASLGSAKLMHRSDPIPAEIRAILEKSLAEQPASRYPSASEMRQALDKLLSGGEYAPTTFNLAFYLHNLLKKELEAEAHEREKESTVSLAPYLVPETAPAPARQTPAPAPSPAPFTTGMFADAVAAEKKKSKAPLIAAAALLLVAAGGAGAWFVMKPKAAAQPKAAPVQAAVIPAPQPAKPIEPIIASVPGTDSAVTSTSAAAVPMDEAARRKAIEDAVNKKLQEEMMKLQEQYNRELAETAKKQEPAPAKAAAVTPPPPAATRTQPAEPKREEVAPPSASQLDTARRAESQPQATPAVAQAQPPAPAPVRMLRDGDLVQIGELDSVPELRTPVRPVYPPMAIKKKAEGTIIVSALITEDGRVADVRVLRGDNARLGFDEAAIRAVKNASFTVPMKDGKRVKTWKPLPIIFKLGQ